MRRNEKVTQETTTFFYLLKLTTLKPFVLSFSFFFSLAISAVFFCCYKGTKDFVDLINFTSTTMAPISGTLMGILIAGLAILITLTQGRLLSLFLHKNILQKFLFPFWVLSAFWAISAFVCILLKFLISANSESILYIFTLEVFVFCYALFSTVSLMGHAIRMGIYIASLGPENDQ